MQWNQGWFLFFFKMRYTTIMMMQRRGKMKAKKSDDCRSKPLESEDGMTSAQVRQTLDRRNTNSSFAATSTGRKKDVEGARGRSLSTAPLFSMK